MDSNDPIDDLLDEWEEAIERGQNLRAEELCRDCPEYIETLQARIQALVKIDARLSGKLDDAGPSSETLSVNSEITRLAFHAKGGLGAVYRATESELNREVAVKFIHRNLVDNAASRERFSLEAEVTGRLEHPGVVPLYGLGRTEHGRLFYYMRYIDGETLDDAIIRFHRTTAKRGTMGVHSVDFRQLLTSFASVCRTIAYAHNRGIVHRDIKPANVMLGKYGETIVVDWGLAVPVTRDDRFRQSGEASLMPNSGSNSGTSSGAGVGTPAYMSPEQMSGLLAAPASDIYSLGATLFKILTGQPAFSGNDLHQLKQNVLEGKIPRPRSQQAGVSEELEAVCLKAMSLQPAKRYQTALELADDIELYLADAPVSAFAESWQRKSLRWIREHKAAARAIVVAAAAILLISFVSAIRLRQLATNEQDARHLAVQNRHAAEEARVRNLKLSAGFLAQAIGDEIDLRWRLLETEVRSAELRRLVMAANAAPDDAGVRRELSSWLNDRKSCRGKVGEGSVWAVYGIDGVQVSRSPRANSIGKSFQHRDYFHGLGRDKLKDDPDLPAVKPFEYVLQRVDSEQDAVYMSCVFQSSNTHRLIVSFAAPIWDKPDEEENRKAVGVFAVPVEIKDFELPLNAMMFQLDNDPFEDKPGLVIAHPQIGNRSRDQLPPRISEDVFEKARQLRAERLMSRGSFASTTDGFIREFHDPVTDSVSLGAMEPIIVSERPEVVGDTGWFVVVSETEATAATLQDSGNEKNPAK